MTKQNFVPLAPNTSIENYQYHKGLHKGTFSDDARRALAKAVRNKRNSVVMDQWTMDITYKEGWLYIVARNREKLPSGVFTPKELEEKWGKNSVS